MSNRGKGVPRIRRKLAPSSGAAAVVCRQLRIMVN
jgi:hypothetical protein